MKITAIVDWTEEDVKRFNASIITTANGCKEFTRINFNGYGYFYFNGLRVAAHRFAYTVAKGAIPAGLVIDHLCRNTSCVNVEHLEAVTQGVNVARSISSTKKTCKRGHLLEGNNIIPSFAAKGYRACRACDNANRSAKYAFDTGLIISPEAKENRIKIIANKNYDKYMKEVATNE